MTWLMSLPNGLLFYKLIAGKFNLDSYIDMMKISVLAIMKLNFGNDFWLQEDNASNHKSAKVKQFLLQSSINILKWPDLNITEDIWKLISEQFYDGPQFLNIFIYYINQLKKKLKNVIDDIN